jgi:Asp-tRNA(Asn)/Glu-tRNA(Gln) amidotransferase A subunit family amidase
MTTAIEAGAEITSLSATEMAKSIASGALSSRAVVEAHIRRIETINPRINAVVVPLFAQALTEADEADAARARGDKLGSLHGVPITIKESFDVKDTPTTMGLSARAGQLSASDSPLVARLRAAGAIILGKTNVPQMVMYNEADNPVYGRTNNPWNPERATGGSSGGCAAIVAGRGSPLSLGSDIGGSVRLPASACGVHSFKPTSGRLTMLGLVFGDGMAGVRRALKGSKIDWRIRCIVLSAAPPKIFYKLSAWQWSLLGQKRIASDARSLGSLSTKAYWRLVDERTRYRAAFIAALDAGGFDAIICPPDGLPALLHGSSFLLSNAMSYTTLFNLLGLPAGVVAATSVREGEESDRPSSLDVVERAARKVETGSAGLPVGVQIASRHWREDIALSIMSALEEHFTAQPDYPRNPPL